MDSIDHRLPRDILTSWPLLTAIPVALVDTHNIPADAADGFLLGPGPRIRLRQEV